MTTNLIRITSLNSRHAIKATAVVFMIIFLVGCSTKNNAEKSTEIAIDWGEKKEIVSFVYHRFGDDRYPSTNINITNFEAHLKYLKSNDYQVLTFSKAINYLKSDQPAKKTVVITIDDGFSSFYTEAMPLLRKYNLPATLFINTKTVGGNDYMTWTEINEVMNEGIEIGNHTHSHDYFLNLPEALRYKTFREELNLSQKLIEQNTGKLPNTFAYPYGEFDSKMQSIIEEMGFIGAAAQNSGVIYRNTDLFACPRFPMAESYSAIDKFSAKASMKALRIITPSSDHLVIDDLKPQLKVIFKPRNLVMDQLQCFIQGSDCSVVKRRQADTTTVTIAPKTPLQNRRTLFTLTVPDSTGNWHWYSHLWINPAVK